MLEFLPVYREAALEAPHGAERLKVVIEAWEWLLTPWRHESRQKYNGVDCGNLLSGVFANAGMIELPEVLKYPHDFYLHNTDDIFLREVEKYCDRVEAPALPADIAGFRLGLPTISHVGIVIKWPVILHAMRPQGKVTLDDVLPAGPLMRSFVGIWRLKAWCD